MARRQGRDGLPGPDPGPQPRHAHRRPARGGVPLPRGDGQEGGARAGPREPASRRHPRSRRHPAPLPVRAVRRPAAARRHRDGAGREPAVAHPRRAHHRPRRHRRGGDPRPDRGTARPHQRRHPADHAQPGPGRAPLRARRRALRRAAGRGGLGQGGLHRPASPLHDGAAALRPALRHEQDRRRAPDHPRHAAGPRRSARGLRLLGALPDGPARLQAPRTRLLRVAGRRRRQGPGRGRGHAARPRRLLAASRDAGGRVRPPHALLLLGGRRVHAAHDAGARHQPRGARRARGRRPRHRPHGAHLQGRLQEAHRRRRRLPQPARRARPSAWSASPAAARRRWPSASPA